MTILVPYTRINLATIESLSGRSFDLRYVGEHSDMYACTMAAWWLAQTSFVVVEHDVVVQPTQIEQLERCPEAWCAFNEYDGGPPTLSVARFRQSFIQANVSVWTDLLRERSAQPKWSLLDSWLVSHADRRCHVHENPHAVNTRPWGTLHAV